MLKFIDFEILIARKNLVAQKKIIIIGGGASGLFAAGCAAKNGANVLVLEKKDRPGRKLLITGKGRCNITNTAPLPEFINHFGKNGRFLRQAFNVFFNNDLVEFFESIGVATTTERGGRIFPTSSEAKDIVDALVKWNHGLGVRIKNSFTVEKLLIDNNRIIGVSACPTSSRSDKQPPKTSVDFFADAVILAAGGSSYPATGSNGAGIKLAAQAGHTIVPVRPALVPIITAGTLAQQLQGLSLKNVTATLWIDNKKGHQDFGEMLFTHYGLSGPIILSLSRRVVDALAAGSQVEISIDLKPALDEQKLDARLLRDFDASGKKQFQSILKGLLPQKMIPVCCECTQIPPDLSAGQISAKQRKRLLNWLKDVRFKVTGHRDFNEAIITAGGIETKEINPRTMESRLVNGLYLAGEVIDIDADTGGFNLQAAFSTGRLAGYAASQH